MHQLGPCVAPGYQSTVTITLLLHTLTMHCYSCTSWDRASLLAIMELPHGANLDSLHIHHEATASFASVECVQLCLAVRMQRHRHMISYVLLSDESMRDISLRRFNGIFMRVGCVTGVHWHRLWVTLKAYVLYHLHTQQQKQSRCA